MAMFAVAQSRPGQFQDLQPCVIAREPTPLAQFFEDAAPIAWPASLLALAVAIVAAALLVRSRRIVVRPDLSGH